jgi:hypothetical protein
VRRLLLPLVVLLVWAGAARAEIVVTGQVADAELARGPNGAPVAAYVANGVLSVAMRVDGAWPASSLALPSHDVEIDGLVVDRAGRPSVLVRDPYGTWLGLAVENAGGWSWRLIHPDTRQALIGPAGLALDRLQRPVLAYAVWFPSRKTFLRLVRTDAKGKLVTGRVTRKGFPASQTLPAAAPVVLGSGAVRVVETYLPAAIEWRAIPGDWLGQFLHATALGVPEGGISTMAVGSTVYAAWTEAFPTLGPPGVVLAAHSDRARSSLALEDALLAGLALTPDGPEVAANRCDVEDLCTGLVGAASRLDGVVAGFTAGPDGTRDVLLARADALEWFRAPGPFSVHLTLTPQLSGRVDEASGGSVLVYQELPRTLVATVPLAADGSFVVTDSAALPAGVYRAVYVEPVTGIPYAALTSTGG